MSKRHAKEEMTEFKRMASIDANNQYHLGNPITCAPKYNTEALAAIKKCEDGDKYIKDAALLIMEDGGLNLRQFADKMANAPSTKENQERMEAFWKEGRRMIVGIQELLEKKLIHHDLKPENVVYDEENHRMNLIDFGFLTRFSTIRKESAKSANWLSQMHWSYPPEIQLFNKKEYMKYASKTDKEKVRFVKTIIKDMNLKKKNIYTDAFRAFFSYVIPASLSSQEYDKMASLYFYHFEQMMVSLKPAEYKNFIDEAITTIDIYGLGIAFMYVLNHTGHLISGDFKEGLEQLFRKMITSNVFERISADDLLKSYDPLLENHVFMEKKGHQLRAHGYTPLNI